jgi:hypothetical protein
MARQPQRVRKGGPYLAAAFFCETAIEDKADGAISAIRIIDQFRFVLDPSAPPNIPSETHRLAIPLMLVLGFKTGDAAGDHALRIDLQAPSGKTKTAVQSVMRLAPQPNGGITIRMQTTIHVPEAGLFWFNVYVDDKEVTRMPMFISVERARPLPHTGPAGRA